MGTIKDRLTKLEKAADNKPPYDIFGKYYDALSDRDKKRFWHYIYGDSYTMEQAEEIEKNYVSGTLHFVCELKISDYDFSFLDSFDAKLKRL